MGTEAVAAIKELGDKMQSELATMRKENEELRTKITKLEATPATGNLRGILPGTPIGEMTEEQRRHLKIENRDEAMRMYARGLDPFNGRGVELGTFLRTVAVMRSGTMPGRSMLEVSQRVGGKDFADKIERHVRALGEGIFADGGAVVPEIFAAQLIEFLRPASILQGLGMPTVPMPNGNLSMPRMTDGADAYYKLENSAGTISQQGFGQRRLSAKTLTSLVPASNELLADAPAYFDAALRDDIVRALVVRRDLAGIRGSGVSLEPAGIKSLMDSANQIASAGDAAPSVATVDAEVSSIVGAVEDADIPLINPVFITSKRVRRYLGDLRDGTGKYVYREEINAGKFRGYPLGVTTNVPKNLGAGGDESEFYFGDLAQLVMGDTLDMQVEFFKDGTYYNGSTMQSGINNNESVFRVLSRHDFQLRHPLAFAMLTGVRYGA